MKLFRRFQHVINRPDPVPRYPAWREVVTPAGAGSVPTPIMLYAVTTLDEHHFSLFLLNTDAETSLDALAYIDSPAQKLHCERFATYAEGKTRYDQIKEDPKSFLMEMIL